MWRWSATASSVGCPSSCWLLFLTAIRRALLLGVFMVAGFAVANWLSGATAAADCGEPGLASLIDPVAPTPKLIAGAPEVIAHAVEKVGAPANLPQVDATAARFVLGSQSRSSAGGPLPTALDEACLAVVEALPPVSGPVLSGGAPLLSADSAQQDGGVAGLVETLLPLVETLLPGHSPSSTGDSSISVPTSPVAPVHPAPFTADGWSPGRGAAPATATSFMTSERRPTDHRVAGAVVDFAAAPAAGQSDPPANDIPARSVPHVVMVSGSGMTSSASGNGGLVLGAVLPSSVTPGGPFVSRVGLLDEVRPVRQVADDPAVSPD